MLRCDHEFPPLYPLIAGRSRAKRMFQSAHGLRTKGLLVVICIITVCVPLLHKFAASPGNESSATAVSFPLKLCLPVEIAFVTASLSSAVLFSFLECANAWLTKLKRPP